MINPGRLQFYHLNNSTIKSMPICILKYMRDCFYHNKMPHCKSQEKLQYFLARCSFNDIKKLMIPGVPRPTHCNGIRRAWKWSQCPIPCGAGRRSQIKYQTIFKILLQNHSSQTTKKKRKYYRLKYKKWPLELLYILLPLNIINIC